MDIEELDKQAKILKGLLDTDPAEAIRQASLLSGDESCDSIKSTIFIDAGSDLGDESAIRQGVAILKHLVSQHPDEQAFSYNLANGLHTLALMDKTTRPTWYLNTHSLRHEARLRFHNAANTGHFKDDLATQASTNKARLLNASYRWVEAYDAYLDALRLEPKNGVASSGAFEILQYCIKLGFGDKSALARISAKYAKITKASHGVTRRFVGEQESKAIIKRITQFDTNQASSESSDTCSESGPYEKFVKSQRLFLSLTIEGLDMSVPRWDSLAINHITESIDAAHGVPPIFGMFNIMKSDYLAARWLAYMALNSEIPESGLYMDTLDYAVYGTKYSLLTLAQRSAHDVLDKIAVATSNYLALPNSKGASFAKAWHKQSSDKKVEEGQSPQWVDQIKTEIEDGNVALIALSEVAQDVVANDGYLRQKHLLRRAATHRFLVLHDMGSGDYRTNECVEHLNLRHYEIHVIQTLQLVRAALIYFVEMIMWHEHLNSKNSDGPIPSLYVPTHHQIRGEE